MKTFLSQVLRLRPIPEKHDAGKCSQRFVSGRKHMPLGVIGQGDRLRVIWG